MSGIRLVSTDFDGTLVHESGDPPWVERLAGCLLEMRERGVLWAINTGRRLDHLDEGMRNVGFPVLPDFVLTSEREVYRRAGGPAGWEAFGPWNERCRSDHELLLACAQPLLVRLERHVSASTAATFVRSHGHAEGLIASSEPEMDSLVALIESMRGEVPLLGYQRNSIYLRFCHVAYHKGSALAELGRLLGITRDAILAIGDHHNDISMLDGVHAAHVACPANAIEEVKAHVRRSGGHVASQPVSAGVAEALEALGVAGTTRENTAGRG